MPALAALVLIALAAEPTESDEVLRQGVEIATRNNGARGQVSLAEAPKGACQVDLGHPCFLSAAAGRHTFLVDGAQVDVGVPRGESAFRIEHVSYSLAGIGAGFLLAGPLLGYGAIGGMAMTYYSGGPSFLSAVFSGMALVGAILSVLALPLIVIDLIRPHTLLVPIPLVKPVELGIQLAPQVAPGRAALAMRATF